MTDIVGAITSASSQALKELRELEARREELLKTARADALRRAEEAIKELNELGFNYRLVETLDDTPTAPRQRRGRRAGIRDEVLEAIKQHPNGISPSDLIDTMGRKGDKKGETSIRNALAALKKDNQVHNENGLYTAATTGHD